jgi:hypothetical protein
VSRAAAEVTVHKTSSGKSRVHSLASQVEGEGGAQSTHSTVKSPNIDFDPKDRHPWSDFYFRYTSSGIELRDVRQKCKNNV